MYPLTVRLLSIQRPPKSNSKCLVVITAVSGNVNPYIVSELCNTNSNSPYGSVQPSSLYSMYRQSGLGYALLPLQPFALHYSTPFFLKGTNCYRLLSVSTWKREEKGQGRCRDCSREAAAGRLALVLWWMSERCCFTMAAYATLTNSAYCRSLSPKVGTLPSYQIRSSLNVVS